MVNCWKINNFFFKCSKGVKCWELISLCDEMLESGITQTSHWGIQISQLFLSRGIYQGWNLFIVNAGRRGGGVYRPPGGAPREVWWTVKVYQSKGKAWPVQWTSVITKQHHWDMYRRAVWLCALHRPLCKLRNIFRNWWDFIVVCVCLCVYRWQKICSRN